MTHFRLASGSSPRWLRLLLLLQAALLVSLAAPARADEAAAANAPWPPALPGANAKGTLTFTSPELLQVPDSVRKEMDKPNWQKFTVAKVAPTIDLAYHRDLPDPALNGTGWSSWGDICVAKDGRVYCGIGDHGKDQPDDKGPAAGHVFIYEWDPVTKALKQVLDPNEVPPRQSADIRFTKVHAGIQQANDGKIIIICTLNDGGTAGQVKWTDHVPGSPVLAYDQQTGKAERIFSLPHRCSATTVFDHQRNLEYLCLEGNEDKELKGSALAAFDPVKRELVYRSPDNVVTANRNIALDNQGNVYFNGKDGKLMKYDPNTKSISESGLVIPKVKEPKAGKPGEFTETQPTMRSSTRQGKDGWIYASTMGPGQLFRFNPQAGKLEMLGLDFGHGEYTTVSVLSPDEKYVYYLPGAHNGAMNIGTPAVQYNVATGERKVLAFLRPYCEKNLGYVPAGTYGVKLSDDGATLYVNFNGHGTKDTRLPKMTESGFGFTSFAAIHIPKEER